MAKVSIQDIADVFNNHWPVGPKGEKDAYYMEDEGPVWGAPSEGGGAFTQNRIDGSLVPKDPFAVVNLADFDFNFVWQGDGPEVPGPASFASHFRKITKARTHTRMVIDVPKDVEVGFGLTLKAFGIKVVK